ncbi:isochorismatase family protein [Mucilaginibacter sp.]
MITALDEKTALVLIDMQNGIVALPLAHPVAGVIENTVKLADAFRKAGRPVVIVNVDPAKFKPSRKEPAPSHGSLPADFTGIIPELKTTDSDIFVTKSSWGAFDTTDLDAQLKKAGITGIVIAGISSSIGVEGTARNAAALGYNLTFASDAMTDMFADAHAHSFKFIFPRLGEVDTTENILKFV